MTGIPASGAGPLVDLLVADGAPTRESVAGQLVRERLNAPRHHVTVESRWVPDGSLDGGHWEEVGRRVEG